MRVNADKLAPSHWRPKAQDKVSCQPALLLWKGHANVRFSNRPV